MNVDRRTVLTLGALSAVAAGCAPTVQRFVQRDLPEDLSLPPRPEPALRTLERAGFGALPGQARLVAEQTPQGWLEEQLSPGEEDRLLLFWLSRLDVNRLKGSDLRDLKEAHVVGQLRQAALLRATYTKWPLRERMVDFWSNHFNIYAQKNWGAHRMSIDQLEVIQKHALGSFPEMLRASAHSAAMLGYLDNQLNTKGVANENYARELMELHTLGVHGGYTQADVREVARAFTGWGIEDRFMRPRERFRFDQEAHDDGPKTILGRKFAAGQGKQTGDEILDMLAHHPNTAKFLARKLSRALTGETEGPAVDAAAKAYLASGGDIKATIRPLLFSEAFQEGQPLVKRPFDYVVSSLRALAAETDGGAPLHTHLEKMGQPLYGWPMPDGYPDRTAAWTGSLLARWNFAYALTHDQIGGTRFTLSRVEALFSSAAAAAAQIASPTFMWR